MLNKSITAMVLMLSAFMTNLVHSFPLSEDDSPTNAQHPFIHGTLDVDAIVAYESLKDAILEAFGGGTGITPGKIIGADRISFEVCFFEPRKEERVSREEASLRDIFGNRGYTRLSFNGNVALGDGAQFDQLLTPESLLTHITITVNIKQRIRTSV